MDSIDELIEHLKTGEYRISDLTWKEFEEIVLRLIIRQNYDLWQNPVKVQKNSVGEIDIVIETQSTPSLNVGKNPLPLRKEMHFIECKHRNSKITLEVAAKIFCAGILYKPNNLIIVSSYPLYPQALDYAQKFFKTDNSVGIFNSIYFCRLSILDLLNIDTKQDNNHIKEMVDKEKNMLEVEYWELVEENVFTKNIIANSSRYGEKVFIDTNCKYILRFWFTQNYNKSSSTSISIISKDKKLLLANDKIKINTFEGGEIKCEVNFLDMSFENEFLFCFEYSMKTKIIGPIKLPSLEFVTSQYAMPDFRFDETLEFGEKLASNNNIKIALIHGEGGIGKTFFSESIVKQLKSISNATQITIDENSTPFVFYRLIWPLIIPLYNGEVLPSSDNVIGVELLTTFLKDILKDEKITSADEVIDNILKLRYQHIDKEVLIFICARVITALPEKTIIIIRDCHKLSFELIKDLKMLLVMISDFGWGNVTLLFEYRDNYEDRNEFWEAFVNEITSEFKSKCIRYKIEPLSKHQLNKGLEKNFSGTNISEFCDIILKKAGGNPLFITQLINYFTEHEFIREINLEGKFYKYNIIDIAGIREELRELPDSVSVFIKKRVVGYYKNTTIKDKKNLVIYLGLSSIIGFQIFEDKVNQVLKLDTSSLLKLRKKLINDGILTASYSYPPATFVHEIMQIAIREIFRQDEDFIKAVLELESFLSYDVIQDVILGGKLNYEIFEQKKAYDWFNRGFELGNVSGNYTIQRICLDYLKNILDKESIEENNVDNYVNIILELGWNEFHSNSLINSIDIYKGLINKLDIDLKFKISDQRKFYIYKIEAIHNLLTVYVDLLLMKESLETMSSELKIINDSERFLYLLNRFILLSTRANFPLYATEIANIACYYTRDKKPDQIWSVLYSDIGHIFLEYNPNLTYELWEKGLELAEDQRQTTHSKLNLLICNLRLNRISENIIDFLGINEKQILEQGLEGQIVRLFSYKGTIKLSKNEIKEARYYFGKALKKSILSNFKIQEWQSHNNLAIVALKENNFDLAIKHFEKAATIVSDINKINKGDIEIIEKEILAKHLSFSEHNFMKIFNSPLISGNIIYLTHNLYSLYSLTHNNLLKEIIDFSKLKKIDFNLLFLSKFESHPLFVMWNNRKLIISID